MARRGIRVGWLTIEGGAATYAALGLVGALVLGLAKHFTLENLLLVPELTLGDLKLWQLVTYSFFPAPDALSVIFGMLIIVGIGSELERRWGTQRYWLFTLGIGVVAGLLTVALSLLLKPLAGLPQFGFSVAVSTQWVAYGLYARGSPMRFWSLPVTGYTFAAIGVLLVVLNGLFQSWLLVFPQLFGMALAFAIVHLGVGDLWTRFRGWQLQRQLKKRSSRLSVVSGPGRNTPRDSDKYLH
jgi:membrane associated rhomboid family serine protease